jgi:C_GCAxxG_C_C family probable redox protein
MGSMPPEQARAYALARFRGPEPERINCAQAVLVYALLRLDEDPDTTQAKFLGGGVTGMGEICGALSGLALALGVRDQVLATRGVNRPTTTANELKALLREFEQRYGSRRCRELTGHDLSTPEGMIAFRMSDIHARCSDYVGWAIDRLEPLLQPALAGI